MQTLADAQAARIPAESLWLDHPVQSLRPTGKGAWEVASQGRTLEADAVILAIQPAKMRPLIGPLDDEWDKLLSGVPAHDSATLNLVFRTSDVGFPLDGFGFVASMERKGLIAGVSFVSRKFEGRAPEGYELLRVFLGAEAARSFRSQDNEHAVVEKVLEELNPILKLKSGPVVRHLAFYSEAMTYYRPGHLSLASRMLQKAGETKGLYLAGNGLGGVGIPDCIVSGETAAEKAFADLLS